MFQDFDENGNVTGAAYQVSIPEITGSDKVGTILVQSSVDITGVQSWDSLNSSWTWWNNSVNDEATREGSVAAFKKVGETTREMNQQTISYNVYHYTGEPSGEQFFRIFVD